MNNHPPRNTIRTFALICVAITSIFVMGMSIWSQWLVGMVDWCGKVIGSAAYTDGRPDFAIKGCVELMQSQIGALANNGLIFGGVVALCLLALMVIVVAGGKLSFTGPGGFGGSVGKEEIKTPEELAAEHVVEGAKDAAADVTAAVEEGK